MFCSFFCCWTFSYSCSNYAFQFALGPPLKQNNWFSFVYFGKVIHSTFHSTAPEFAPLQLLQPYSAALCMRSHTPPKPTWYLAPVTNHYPIKNISSMPWGHNVRPSGGLEFFTSFISLSKVSHFHSAEICLLVLSD